jgi:hypothetical protein
MHENEALSVDRDGSEDHRDGAEAGMLMHLHKLYRGDVGTLQAAIATATGKHRDTLMIVLANLRSEQR